MEGRWEERERRVGQACPKNVFFLRFSLVRLSAFRGEAASPVVPLPLPLSFLLVVFWREGDPTFASNGLWTRKNWLRVEKLGSGITNKRFQTNK